MSRDGAMTLVLIHGAWHGAWCWSALQRSLAGRGVASVAVDLPITDPRATLDDYADSVIAAMAGIGDAVLVAHSLGGLVAPIAAARRHVNGLIMLAALTPEPGRSGRDQARALPGIYTGEYRRAGMIRHGDGSTSLIADDARTLLYGDCSPEVADDAIAQLRPQCWRPFFEACPLASLPATPVAAIGCRDDRLLGAEGIEAGARRLSAPLRWLPSGHSPMLARTEFLADALDSVSRGWR